MAVVEYKRHRVPGGITTPPWVEDGGYWLSPIDTTLVGWTDLTAVYYVPDTVLELTRDTFITRTTTIHTSYPITDDNGDAL
jgi:hypothetical protein